MRQSNRSHARAIAIALPAEPKALVLPWQAIAMGLLTSVVMYALAMLLAMR